jgi:hypothetical protein
MKIGHCSLNRLQPILGFLAVSTHPQRFFLCLLGLGRLAGRAWELEFTSKCFCQDAGHERVKPGLCLSLY